MSFDLPPHSRWGLIPREYPKVCVVVRFVFKIHDVLRIDQQLTLLNLHDLLQTPTKAFYVYSIGNFGTF